MAKYRGLLLLLLIGFSITYSFFTVGSETFTACPVDGIINSNKQIARYSSSGNGSHDSPFLIDGRCIDAGAKKYDGLVIKNTDSYVVLKNINIQDTTIGLSIDRVKNLTIADSRFSNILKGAISVIRSKNISIEKNNIERTGGRGVFVKNSSNVIIQNNRVTNTGNRGIDIYFPWKNVIVSNNHVSKTLKVGAGGECIEAWGGNLAENSGVVFSNNIVHDCSDEGLEFVGVIGGTIKGNIAFNNVGQGIDLWNSNGNDIVNNIVSGNQKYGMYITNSSRNNISHNIFQGNKPRPYLIRKQSDGNKFVGNIIADNGG